MHGFIRMVANHSLAGHHMLRVTYITSLRCTTMVNKLANEIVDCVGRDSHLHSYFNGRM